jgi:hypothetical protein
MVTGGILERECHPVSVVDCEQELRNDALLERALAISASRRCICGECGFG